MRKPFVLWIAVAGAGNETTELQRQVLRVVQESRAEVVESALRQIEEAIPTYESGGDDLHQSLVRHLELNLDAFLASAWEGRTASGLDLGFISQMVALRVEQGVPMADVLHAFRVGLQVLWNALLEQAEAQGVGSDAALSLVLPAMRFIDAASSEVTESYIRIEHRLQAGSDRLHERAIEAMIGGRLPEDEVQLKLGQEFVFEPDSSYLVVALGSVLDTKQPELRAALVTSTRSVVGQAPIKGCLVTNRLDETIALFAADESAVPAAIESVRILIGRAADRARCEPSAGIGLPAGLVELRDGYEEARLASQTIGPGEILAVGDMRVRDRVALLAGSGVTVDRLIPPALREWLWADIESGSVMLNTIEAYAAADMSARAAASKLYVHPNTVLYRLGQAAELSGFDPRKADDLADLLFAISLLKRGR